MADPYKEFSEVYDKCGIGIYSTVLGKSILKYFNEKHPNETFKSNLDVCCGTGVLCNYFYNQNISSKGIDISAEMIKKAREKFPEVEFICEDASEFNDSFEYDFITCTDDAVNHFTDVNLLKKIFININNSLRDDGLFIFDIHDFVPVVGNEYVKSGGDDFTLKYNVTAREEGLVCFHVEYYEKENLKFTTEVFERDYSVKEMKKILKECGFEIELYDKSFYDSQENHKWKVVARKISK